MEDNFFSEENLAQANWFKFKNVGDAVKGILVGKRHQSGASQGFSDQIVCELRQEDGSVINVGFSVDKTYIINRLRNIALGQMVGFKFMKEVPSATKGYAPAKSIEVYAGSIDPSYKAEEAEAAAGDEGVKVDGIPF